MVQGPWVPPSPRRPWAPAPRALPCPSSQPRTTGPESSIHPWPGPQSRLARDPVGGSQPWVPVQTRTQQPPGEAPLSSQASTQPGCMSPGHVLGSVCIGLHDPGNPPEGAVTPVHREETEDQPWPPGMKRTLRGKNPGKKGVLLLSHSSRGGGAPSCRLRTLALQRLQNKAWAAS